MVVKEDTWQYKIEFGYGDNGGKLPEDELNHFGKEGWELVAVIKENCCEYIFKRKIT